MTTPQKASERIFERPVAWLLGKQLLGGLKGILLYSAYGAKLDPRDWMAGQEVTFATPEAESKDEFWFDYLSDAGDGTKAMYSLAYLAMTSLWTRLNVNSTALPTNESDRQVSTTNDANDGFTLQLPRGEFLFFGGDTSYHAAEYMTLVNRIQRPFNYAYEDLRTNKLISDDDPRRPIFGIPGNHDYYDQIDGFRRQFRRPVRPEGPLPPKQSSGHNAQLTIAGFKRVQEASYVALRLPFNWQMWGLDTESESNREKLNLDRRQEEFFHTVSSEDGERPDKLIVATCSPSTVFGKAADPLDPKVARSMAALKIDTPFLPTKDQTGLATTGDEQLDKGQCRLDLSGDVHHYARYWGPNISGGTSPRKHSTAPQPSARSYASVVSGAGGAFHHPSTTYDNEICEQVLYPPESVSRAAVADRIFKFWNVATGGYVWLAGFIMAFTIYFSIVASISSRQFISNVGFLNALDVTQTRAPEKIGPTLIQTEPTACDSVTPFGLWLKLGVVNGDWKPPAGCTPAAPIYFFPDPSSWPPDLIIGQIFVYLSLAAIFVTLYLSVFTKVIFNNESPYEEGSNPDKILWPLVGVTALLVIVGLFTIRPYRDHITPFVSSLLVLYSIFAAITTIALNFRYSEYLFKKSFVQPPKKGLAGFLASKLDEYLTGTLWLTAVVVVTAGLWFFGKNNLPPYLASDIVFIVVLLAAAIGIMLLPFKVGADLFYTKSKIAGGFFKTLIGVWHLILQLLVPYILILNGNFYVWVLAAILLVAPIPLAQLLMKKDSRVALTLLWFIYGIVMLTLPWSIAWLLAQIGMKYVLVFPEPHGWSALLPATVAGIIGAIICCLWTGWYFAVCFAFNGHNNEVGGTARIEEFKQFIRFRLTKDGLTGFVIAVDDVSLIDKDDGKGRKMDGSDLKPKLIDVFHLVPK